MSDLKEYVVTAQTMADADSIIADMQSPGGNLYIPNRLVGIAQYREISRNTHFYLSDSEAEILRADPRVIAVELTPAALGIEVTPHWTQTGNFEKSRTNDGTATDFQNTDKNWGLYRCITGERVAGWGKRPNDLDRLFTQVSGTIKTTSSGKNVDVVIVDEHINFNHPEFAVNPDGTGGSRATPYNWYQLSSSLGINTAANYSYNFTGNHGTHTAGTTAGNTQGWARDANIYSIGFQNSNFAPGNWELYLFDYIRKWHKTKPINPATGRRNPTITNNSWGYSYNSISVSQINSVTYRGTTTAVTGTTSQMMAILQANGVPLPYGSILVQTPYRYAALDADIQDAINDGVIVVGSAGNSYWNCATPDSVDWNNSVNINGFQLYHSRGSSPGSSANVICVGAASATSTEYKTDFSNFGPRVDVYAPGENIISSVYNSNAGSEFGTTMLADPRNSNFYIASINGTSMAGPQVTGMMACLLEQYPSYRQSQVLDYIKAYSKTGQLQSKGVSPYNSPYQNLGSYSNNRYLYYRLERPLTGSAFPKINYGLRPTTGAVWPRPRRNY